MSEETVWDSGIKRKISSAAIALGAFSILAASVLATEDRTNDRLGSGSIYLDIDGLDSRGAGVTATAERIPNDVHAPNAITVPPSELERIRNLTVSFNNCSASIVVDDHGIPLGIMGAKHCLNPDNNYNNLWYGHDKYHSGARRMIAPYTTPILQERNYDIFYLGDFGHSAEEVRNQIIINNKRIVSSGLPINTEIIYSGFPAYSNSAGKRKTLQLAYGGLLYWSSRLKTYFYAGFGDWMDGSDCSNQGSGGGLHFGIPGYGLVLGVPLATYAEFNPVVNSPYVASYGEELRQYFSGQLGVSLDDAQYMCGGFAPFALQP